MVKILFKSRFSQSVARSIIITVIFFATVDEFLNVMIKDIAFPIMALITFYMLFIIFAFTTKQKGNQNEK
ncbi:MAG: hypothetical protein ABIG89_06895 [Candidatus Woesearchaeota archaeon]